MNVVDRNGSDRGWAPRVIHLASDPGPRTVKVLLVEEDPLFASLIRSTLTESSAGFEVETVSWLSSALACLHRHDPDLILTDLNLPDSRGAGTVRALKRAAPRVPVIALSRTDDFEVALDAVREGAEECVSKATFSVHSLVWLVALALERHRRLMADLDGGHADPLTGPANRSALEVFGRYLLRLADRTGMEMAVLYLRIETAPRGRWADREALLVEVSGVLEGTLRRCDVLSRVGPTELAVALVSDGHDLVGVLPRVRKAIVATGAAAYVHVGLALHCPGHTQTLNELLDLARAGADPVPA